MGPNQVGNQYVNEKHENVGEKKTKFILNEPDKNWKISKYALKNLITTHRQEYKPDYDSDGHSI